MSPFSDAAQKLLAHRVPNVSRSDRAWLLDLSSIRRRRCDPAHLWGSRAALQAGMRWKRSRPAVEAGETTGFKNEGLIAHYGT